MPEKRNIFRLLRELISPRTHLWTQAIFASRDAGKLLADYFQERIDAGELKHHKPVIPIQMLISSFFTSLVAEQPLDLLGPQLVDTLLDGIRAQGPGD